MSFDGLVMAATRHELLKKIAGGRIEKIYQPLAEEIVLIIHKDRNKFRLLASANARDARIHLTGTARENPLTPPLFCMVLRKHLEGGKISGIDQTGLERVLVIRVEAVDELGILSEKNLVIEIMGKHSNIVLVDPASNMVLDGINRYSYATSRHREILPGRQYTPPPETGKINPLEVGEDEFRSAMWDPDRDMPVESLILQSFDGFSPQTCREIVTRAGLEPGMSSQSLGELELNLLWQVFREIMDNTKSDRFQPVGCYEGSRPEAFSAIGFTRLPGGVCKTGNMSEILDEFFSVRERQEQFRRTAADLNRVVGGEIKKCRKKIAIHEENLRRAENAEILKIFGELITSNIYQIPRGAKSVEFVNYYDPAGKTVCIELDPRLAPAENAQAYFKRYVKARSGKTAAESFLVRTRAELAYLESVAVAVNQAELDNDLVEIRAELTKEGYIRPAKTKGPAKKTGPTAEPKPMSFTSGEGLTILVGRNNRQNDYLTMKLAGPDDIWIHVRDIPGAHVIVQNRQAPDIPDGTLKMAAEIAAFYSRARESSKVPVDYTLRKNVRKPKGAKPGMVIYENYQTIIVEPKSP